MNQNDFKEQRKQYVISFLFSEARVQFLLSSTVVNLHKPNVYENCVHHHTLFLSSIQAHQVNKGTY